MEAIIARRLEGELPSMSLSTQMALQRDLLVFNIKLDVPTEIRTIKMLLTNNADFDLHCK